MTFLGVDIGTSAAKAVLVEDGQRPLDSADGPLRPAILWNDGRAQAECRLLAERVPDLGRIAGVPAMPGLTAPKLLWLAAHEPEILARTARFVLPKDYVRL